MGWPPPPVEGALWIKGELGWVVGVDLTVIGGNGGTNRKVSDNGTHRRTIASLSS